jgi:hypothetical protein
MLEQATFLKGIKYLNAYYTNFNFNINDDLKLKVWYEVFTAFDNATFTELIKSYCIKNIYAPQSPAHIFEHAKNEVFNKTLEKNEAWNYALSLLRQFNYDFRRFYDKCEYGIITDIIKSLKPELEGVHTENLPFVKNKFIAMYELQIKKEISEIVLNGQLRLANYEQKVLNYSSGKVATKEDSDED